MKNNNNNNNKNVVCCSCDWRFEGKKNFHIILICFPESKGFTFLVGFELSTLHKKNQQTELNDKKTLKHPNSLPVFLSLHFSLRILACLDSKRYFIIS